MKEVEPNKEGSSKSMSKSEEYGQRQSSEEVRLSFNTLTAV